VVFPTIGKAVNLTTGFACYPVVLVRNNHIESYTPGRTHGVPISERIARLQGNPKRAASLARARVRLGAWVASEPELQATGGLAAMRLKAGLSQAQLAGALGTSQPNVARMEKGTGNYTLDSMRAWASAVGVSLTELIAAIEVAQVPA